MRNGKNGPFLISKMPQKYPLRFGLTLAVHAAYPEQMIQHGTVQLAMKHYPDIPQCTGVRDVSVLKYMH